MLTAQNIEAELSYAYLHAVASRAGIICENGGRHSDEAGVDAVLRVYGELAPDSLLTQFTVDIQLKATIAVSHERNGKYSFPLRLKNYDELRSTKTSVPQVLIVLFLPQDAAAWLTQSEDALVARRCGYWASLRGAPESENETSQTVYIPRANVLSVELLRDLMVRFSKREVIEYVA
ncbi:MAG TPA: DUF4365 domain-containing protein [Pirellulales bacterium]|nr:DUF4365 domain-containing protein [Pirellulales bacterium]